MKGDKSVAGRLPVHRPSKGVDKNPQSSTLRKWRVLAFIWKTLRGEQKVLFLFRWAQGSFLLAAEIRSQAAFIPGRVGLEDQPVFRSRPFFTET